MSRNWMGLLLFCFLCSTVGGAQGELTPATGSESLVRTVRQRLCYAGRFKVEQTERGNVFLGRLVEQVASSAGHPNAVDLGEIRVVRRDGEEFRLDVGNTYCLVVTAGSKQGMTVVALGPDDATTLKAVKSVMESASAFENDESWRKRRALWTKFRNDVGTNEQPVLYAEDDAFQNILYLRRGPEPFPLYLYNARDRKSEPIVHAKVIPGINRITFDDQRFLVWFNGSVELEVGIKSGE